MNKKQALNLLKKIEKSLSQGKGLKEKMAISDRISTVASYVRGLSGKVLAVGRVRYDLFRNGKLIQAGRWTKNLVTDEGDDHIVDALATTPAKTAMDCMALGTGWTSAAKGDVWLTTGFTGNGHDTANQGAFDSGYPQVKSGAGNENILQYKSTFEAGYATQDGIDEAIIANVNPAAGGGDPGTGEILAHGQLTPVVNKGASDNLIVTWEITFLGA